MHPGNSVIDADSIIKATDDQVSSMVGDEEVILNLKDGSYYGLDPVGAHIWTRIQEPVAIADLVDQLMQEFDVTRERCTTDVLNLMHDLHEHELVDINPPA